MITKAADKRSLFSRNLDNFTTVGDAALNVNVGRALAPEELIGRYMHWAWMCISLNSRVGAGLEFKLFSVGNGQSDEERTLRRAGYLQPLQKDDRAFLEGRMPFGPSPSVKAMLPGRMDDISEVERHPILDLMHRPSEKVDGFAWRETLLSDLYLFGRAFTLATGGEPPLELFAMMVDKTEIIPDPVEFVAGFRYGDVDPIVYMPEDVLWFKLADARNPYGGMGPTEAFITSIDSSLSIESFQQWLMNRGGSPDYVLKTPGQMDEPQKAAFWKSWARMFGILRRRTRSVAILENDSELIKLGQTNRELEFSQSALDTRDRIAIAYGIPKSVITTTDVNMSNAEVGNEQHVRLGIWPYIQRIEGVLNTQLTPKWSDSLFVCWVNPVREDETVRIARSDAMLRTGHSVNEVRRMNEEEPLDTDAADVAMIAQGLAPLEQAVTPASPFGLFGDSLAASAGGSDTGPPADSPGMPVALTTSELVSLGTAVSMGNLTVDAARAFLGVRFGIDPATAAELIPDSIEAGQGEEEPPALPPGQDDDDDDDEEMSLRVMVWDVKSAEVDGDPAKDGNWAISSDPFATSLRKQQDAQSEELLSALDGLLAPTAEMVGTIIGPDDMARWSAETQRAARPHLTDIVDGSGDKAVRDMVGMVDVDLDVGFNVQNPEVVRWITAEGRVIGTGTTRTYASQIARTLGEGVGRGESIGELQKRIEDIASDFTPASAERIARTETAYGFMHGQREGWKQSGVVVGKKWLLAPNPCPFCAATSAKFNSAKNINEPFYTFGTRIAAQFTRQDGTTVTRHMDLDYEGLMSTNGVQGPPLHPNCRCDLVPVLDGQFT